jgi:IS4 transposase
MRDAAFVKACELVVEFRKQAERLRSEVESLRAKLASRTVEWPEWAKAGTRVVVKSCDSYHTAAAQADAEPGFEFVIAEIDRGDSTVGDGKGTWASIFDLEPVAEHTQPAVAVQS